MRLFSRVPSPVGWLLRTRWCRAREPGTSPGLPQALSNSVRTKYWVSKNSRMVLIRPSRMEKTETMFAS
ncbi:hypothetical protein GCM10010280_62980 [Streptomyces pilosus]|uniref:Uncharacterized protein n=1 Tax=Streptomyces pilosus TaxID=28893 RepID=A0A918C627_9ACTN|nr:hypothetical protein GCM10010280_62980 [Streptomyces pilosus]